MYSLARWLSGLVVAFAAEVALCRVARLARPAAALRVSDPRVPVAVRARALERAEHVRALARRMAVVQFRAAAFVQIYNRENDPRVSNVRIECALLALNTSRRVLAKNISTEN